MRSEYICVGKIRMFLIHLVIPSVFGTRSTSKSKVIGPTSPQWLCPPTYHVNVARSHTTSMSFVDLFAAKKLSWLCMTQLWCYLKSRAVLVNSSQFSLVQSAEYGYGSKSKARGTLGFLDLSINQWAFGVTNSHSIFLTHINMSFKVKPRFFSFFPTALWWTLPVKGSRTSPPQLRSFVFQPRSYRLRSAPFTPRRGGVKTGEEALPIAQQGIFWRSSYNVPACN